MSSGTSPELTVPDFGRPPSPTRSELDFQGPPPAYEFKSSPATETTRPVSQDELPPAFRPTSSSSLSSPITPAKLLYISQKGNTYYPWPCGNTHALITPVYDSTRSKLLYNSERFKKSSGTCVQKSEENPSFEVHTTYRFGPGKDPIVSFTIGGKEVQVEIKSKGMFTRTRYFELPEELGGGYFEWRYAGMKGYKGLMNQDQAHVENEDEDESEDEKEGRAASPTSGQPAEKEKRWRWKGKGKSNDSSDSKKNGEKPERCQGYPSRMVLDKYPVSPLQQNSKACTTSACTSQSKEKVPEAAVQPTRIAEFVRADFKTGQEYTSGFWKYGPAGQGGWLKILKEEVVPEWLILSTCLVMLKRERDRRTMQNTSIAYGGGGGGE